MTRALLAASLLAACGPSGDCEVDDDCSGNLVCARNGECLDTDNVRALRVEWTVGGQTASAAACASSPSLYINFFSFEESDTFGYDPVPCDPGLFTIDKLPSRFTTVEIGEHGGFAMERNIIGTGTVSFDLAP